MPRPPMQSDQLRHYKSENNESHTVYKIFIFNQPACDPMDISLT